MGVLDGSKMGELHIAELDEARYAMFRSIIGS